MPRILLFISALILASCEEGMVEELMPRASFRGPFEKRFTNIGRALPDSFFVAREGDTVRFDARFDRKTKYSYLIKDREDTVFAGYVSRQKDLWFLSQQITDTTWWIQAVQADRKAIRGLETMWLQMLMLDSLIESGQYEAIVLERDSSGKYLLEPDKRKLPEMYRSILKNLPAEPLIELDGEGGFEKLIQNGTARDSLFSDTAAAALKLFPNPASGKFYISGASFPCEYQVNDLQGNTPLEGSLLSEDVPVDVTSLSNGIYLVAVRDRKDSVYFSRLEVRH